MIVRLLRLVIGVPLVLLGTFVFLLAITGFITGDTTTDRSLAIFLAAISLVLIVVGARACRKTTVPSTHAAKATSKSSKSKPKLAKNELAWRHDATSESQKKLASKLGITFAETISKGELSDLISDAKGESRFEGGSVTVGQRRKQDKKHAKERLLMAKEQLKFMNQANCDYGDDGLYAGFTFLRIPDEMPSPEEEPYVGTFLPIQIATKYPELLAVQTIDCDDVMSDQRLRRGTRMVVKPGKFKTL